MTGGRGPLEPSLATGERIVFNSQGGYRDHVRSGWKLGRLYLTNLRLLFLSQTSVVFETPLCEVQDVRVEKQRYVAGRVKEVIAVRYWPASKLGTGQAFLITADLDGLRNGLYETVLPELTEEDVKLVAAGLDEQSRSIIGHLWEYGDATTWELTELIEAPGPVDVLHSIKGRINPMAEGMLGCPLVVVDRGSADNGGSGKGSPCWRLITRRGHWEQEALVPLLDVIDEGPYLNVFIELGGVKEEDILLGVGRDRLIVSVEGGDGASRQEVPLPCQVSTEQLTKSYNNNILAISLQKLNDGHRNGLKRLNYD